MGILAESEQIKNALTPVVKNIIDRNTGECLRLYKAIVVKAPYLASDGRLFVDVKLIGDDTEQSLPCNVAAQSAVMNTTVWVGTVYGWRNARVLFLGDFDFGGGGSIAVDSALSTTSANPVQNKVITQALGGIFSVFTSIAVSNWTSDSTYSGYAYRATIALAGVTSSMYAEISFSVAQADSGNYAPVCQTYDGGVYVYGKVNATITIPTIAIWSAVQ